MQIRFNHVFQPTLNLTLKYLWRVLGLNILIMILGGLCVLVPYIGTLVKVFVSGVSELGLFLSVREAYITRNASISLMDQMSLHLFDKKTALQYCKYACSVGALYLIGSLIPLALITFRVVNAPAEINLSFFTSLILEFDPFTISALLFFVLFAVGIAVPASIFSLYLMALDIETSVTSAFKKSLIAFYEHWVLFFQFSLLALLPLISFSVILLGLYAISHSQALIIAAGSLLAILSVIFIIPFYTCFMVVMVRTLFEKPVGKDAILLQP